MAKYWKIIYPSGHTAWHLLIHSLRFWCSFARMRYSVLLLIISTILILFSPIHQVTPNNLPLYLTPLTNSSAESWLNKTCLGREPRSRSYKENFPWRSNMKIVILLKPPVARVFPPKTLMLRLNSYGQRTLTYFVRGNITVWLTSCLTG